MNIITNFRNQNATSFRGVKNEDNLTDEEKNAIVVNKCLEHLLDEIEKKVPEKQKFHPCGIEFKIEGTNNVGRIVVTYDEKNYESQRRVTYGVRHKNSDMVFSNYVFKGTKKEVVDFLSNPEEKANLKEIINDLSSQVDNHYRS